MDPAVIQAAREMDPTAYLEACGYAVKREGRHLSVRVGDDGGEVFRITRREDGRWLWCDRGGSGRGHQSPWCRRSIRGSASARPSPAYAARRFPLRRSWPSRLFAICRAFPRLVP